MKHCYMYIPFATIRNVFVSHIQIVILKKIEFCYQIHSYKTNKPYSLNDLERGHRDHKIYIYWVNIRFLISISIELTYIVTHFPKTTKKGIFLIYWGWGMGGGGVDVGNHASGTSK